MAFPQPNEHGVYRPHQCEILVFKGGGRLHAQILILQVASEEWKVSSEVSLPESFAGGWPSENGLSFPSRMDAIVHEAEWIIKHCESQKQSMHNNTYIRMAQQVIEWCQSLRQPRLF